MAMLGGWNIQSNDVFSGDITIRILIASYVKISVVLNVNFQRPNMVLLYIKIQQITHSL